MLSDSTTLSVYEVDEDVIGRMDRDEGLPLEQDADSAARSSMVGVGGGVEDNTAAELGVLDDLLVGSSRETEEDIAATGGS